MRFVALDSWRGIAALMVAAYHFEATWHGHGASLLANSYLFVDFFFVLSGFVIAHAYGAKINSARDLAAFAVRRFGRLWPLAASVIAAFVAVELAKLGLVKSFGISTGAVPFDPSGYTPAGTLPGHLLLTTALGLHDGLTWNGPDWSISAEFWTYLVFGVVALISGRWRSGGLAVAGLLAAILLVTRAKHGMDATYDLGLARCIYGFMLGQVIYVLRQKLAFSKLPAATAIEFGGVAIVVCYLCLVSRGRAAFLAPLVFAPIVLVFSFEQGALSRALSWGPLRALGDWSYSIYMVHAFVWFVLAMLFSVWQRRLGLDFWQIVPGDGGSTRMIVSGNKFALDLLFAAYLAVILGLAAITKRWIEDPGRAYFASLANQVSRGSDAGRHAASQPSL